MLPGFVLAVDPGTSKMGWALVDGMGKTESQGIILMEGWMDELGTLLNGRDIFVVVMGDGTNQSNMTEGLSRLLPQTQFVVIDEKESTVEAWQLKRQEEAGGNPLRQLAFFFRQLFAPVPVDDYAARVLALRYLKRSQGS